MAKDTKPSNHNKRWDHEDEKYLILQYAAGVSLDCIAKTLNRTLVAVLGRLAVHGLVEFDKKAKAYYTVKALLYQFPV